MWRGEDQALEEGRMMPSWSMCSNSLLAAERRSGARRLGRAETGGPEVTMWWVTLCLMGVSGVET